MVVFFFQAEDGIRDWSVTGVQTCALPIFQSQHVFIYIRGEYTTEYDVLTAALEDARGAGLLGDVRLVIHRGAGAYICGERSEERRVGKECRSRWQRGASRSTQPMTTHNSW